MLQPQDYIKNQRILMNLGLLIKSRVPGSPVQPTGIFKARQKIAEVKKLRQYFKRPDADERKRLLAEKMKTSPCHKCGELGHWSRECPQKGAHGVNNTGTKTDENEWTALAALCTFSPDPKPAGSRYEEHACGAVSRSAMTSPNHESFWCQRELHLHVILDLGCVKSVVGTQWMNALLEEWRRKGRWVRVFPEKEVFQFGNGQSLQSRFAVHFEAILAACHVVLAFSVVQGHCPPLLSRHACSQLGMSINCGNHTYSSLKMKVKNFGLSRASNGHYLLAVDRFLEGKRTELPADFRVPDGFEAYVVSPTEAVMFEPGDRDIAGPVENLSDREPHVEQQRFEEGRHREGLPTMRGRGTPPKGVSAAGCPGGGGDRHADDSQAEIRVDGSQAAGQGGRETQTGSSAHVLLAEGCPDSSSGRGGEHRLVGGGNRAVARGEEDEREKAMNAKTKRENQKALTGQYADFPSLSRT